MDDKREEEKKHDGTDGEEEEDDEEGNKRHVVLGPQVPLKEQLELDKVRRPCIYLIRFNGAHCITNNHDLVKHLATFPAGSVTNLMSMDFCHLSFF
jgi:hypothetical protein